jgi:hypothetical protein
VTGIADGTRKETDLEPLGKGSKELCDTLVLGKEKGIFELIKERISFVEGKATLLDCLKKFYRNPRQGASELIQNDSGI